MMTQGEWMHEATSRIALSEGYRSTRYDDSLGIPTIGIGFNLQRGDANELLIQCGSSLASCMQNESLSGTQVYRLFALSFAPIVAQARASLQATHFDNMSDARRFVLCDLVYNLGETGWLGFAGTRALIDAGCHFNALGDHATAHASFGQAGDHLTASAWYAQVGNRAKRDVAMLRSSNWCAPQGDGSY